MNPLFILSDSDSPAKPSGFDQSLEAWRTFMTTAGVPLFHAEQVMQWIFHHQVLDPSGWLNLPLKLRNQAAVDFSWDLPSIDTRLTSQDGSDKLLLRLKDGLLTEAVLMPSEGRVTLCVSSQVGCRMGCTFCQTGKMGFSRNLTAGEILSQLLIANQILKEKGVKQQVSNIVFMGMGEPLENLDNVLATCRILLDPKLFALSKHRVTVSTSGLVPEIDRLGSASPVALAISLHSADETVRTDLMPVNKRYPLAELKQALLRYPFDARHGVTLEYVMIEGVNDSIQQAKKLVSFIHGLKAKVNLIPMNPYPGSTMKAPSEERMREFQEYLSKRGIPAPIRYSRGRDVSGACGQLAAKRESELHLDPRIVAKARRQERRG